MKKLTLVFILLCLSITSFSQLNDSVQINLQKKYPTINKYGTDDPFYIVGDEVKKGVCDAGGQEIIPPGYFSNVSRYRIFETDKPEISSPEYYSMTEATPSGRKIAIFDAKGNIIIGQGRYSGATTHPTFIEVQDEYGMAGACDWSGREIIVPNFIKLRFNYTTEMFECSLNNTDFISTGISLDGSTKSKEDSMATTNYLKEHYALPDNAALPSFRKGRAYYIGKDCPRDFKIAYAFFDEAAKRDIRKSAGIAEMRRYGIGVEKDELFALWCYEQAGMAGQTDAWAGYYSVKYDFDQREKGLIDEDCYNDYREAIIKASVEQDYWSSSRILEKIADKGYLPAQYDLGTYYMNKLFPCSDLESTQKAEFWLKKSADSGYVLAQNNYAVFLETIKNDSKEAFRYYLQAADANFPPSQYAVGIYYQNGLGGVKQSLSKAEKYLKLSQKGGYDRAENDLAELSDMIRTRKEERLEKLTNIVNGFAQMASIASDVALSLTDHSFISSSAPVYDGTTVQNPVVQDNSDVSLTKRDKYYYNSNTVSDQNVYDDYGRMLLKYYFGSYPYDISEIRTYQNRMKELRLKWVNRGVNFYQSEWETWDGVPKK